MLGLDLRMATFGFVAFPWFGFESTRCDGSLAGFSDPYFGFRSPFLFWSGGALVSSTWHCGRILEVGAVSNGREGARERSMASEFAKWKLRERRDTHEE